MEKFGNIAFTVLYYILKAFSFACVGAVVWIIISGLQVAFTTKSAGTIPEYGWWNFFYLF